MEFWAIAKKDNGLELTSYASPSPHCQSGAMQALVHYLYVRFLAENTRFVVANISNHCRTKKRPIPAVEPKSLDGNYVLKAVVPGVGSGRRLFDPFETFTNTDVKQGTIQQRAAEFSKISQ